MASEIKVKVGREMSTEERTNIDRSKMAVLHPMPPKKSVEGQYPYSDYVICPYCGAGGYAWLESEYYVTVYCCCCPEIFWA
jgi:hypothetical protein